MCPNTTHLLSVLPRFCVWCCFRTVGLRIQVRLGAFCCSQSFCGRIGMPRQWGQRLIVILDSAWVLFVEAICLTVALESCHQLQLILPWSDFWMFVLLSLLSFVCGCWGVPIESCSSFWFPLLVQLSLCCQEVWPSDVSIVQCKPLSLILLTCFSLALRQCNFRWLQLIPWCTGSRWSMLLGIILAVQCASCHLYYGFSCIHLTSSLVSVLGMCSIWIVLWSHLMWFVGFWLSVLLVVGISCVPFGFCLIWEIAFGPLVPLDLAMWCIFILLLPLSMCPWLGSLLQHGGIWLFGKLTVSCRHLPLLRVHHLLLVLILSTIWLLSFCTLGAGEVHSLLL